jgi:undecaprenyl-diphosphatase
LIESNFSSFPSGHATLSFALAFSIFLYDKKIGSLFLLLAFFVAMGRIFTGVHFPLDILVGGILGIFVSWFF